VRPDHQLDFVSSFSDGLTDLTSNPRTKRQRRDLETSTTQGTVYHLACVELWCMTGSVCQTHFEECCVCAINDRIRTDDWDVRVLWNLCYSFMLLPLQLLLTIATGSTDFIREIHRGANDCDVRSCRLSFPERETRRGLPQREVRLDHVPFIGRSERSKHLPCFPANFLGINETTIWRN
jgi:hypothetical protein